MSSSRFTKGVINGLVIVGFGVIGWAFFTPSEEEMRKRLKGSPSHIQTEIKIEEQSQRERRNKELFDVIKKGAGITDDDVAKWKK